MIARITIWPRGESCEVSPPRQSRCMAPLYTLSSRIIDMVRRYWIFLLDDYRTDRWGMRADDTSESGPTWASGSSVLIWSVDGKYCLSAHRISRRTTHTVSRHAMGSRWRDDSYCLRLVGHFTRSSNGGRLCRGWITRNTRDSFCLSFEKL